MGKPLSTIFAGTGTIPVEAAMISKNIAPWKFRDFAFEHFKWYNTSYKKNVLEKAIQKEKTECAPIYCFDIDPLVENVIMEHAENAWVQDCIKFDILDFTSIDVEDYSDITVLSNPPYGERIDPENIDEIYEKLAELFAEWKNIQWWVLTSYNNFFRKINPKQYKLRKLFNGWEKCHLYRYLGKR